MLQADQHKTSHLTTIAQKGSSARGIYYSLCFCLMLLFSILLLHKSRKIVCPLRFIHYPLVIKMEKFNVVPGFILKLWKMINDSHCDHLIAWSADGQSFIISDPQKFTQELSKYFKHNNLSSFIRQLNMYGFRKVTSIGNPGILIGTDDLHFHHPDFIKGKPERLDFIKRKLPQKLVENVDLTDVYKGINGLKNKNQVVTKSLEELKHENALLWAELRALRDKHQQQQLYISRLMKLVFKAMEQNGIKTNMIQSNIQSGMSGPLMIEGSSDTLVNLPATSPPQSIGMSEKLSTCTHESENMGDTFGEIMYDDDPTNSFQLQSAIDASEYQLDSFVPSISANFADNFDYPTRINDNQCEDQNSLIQ